MTRFLVALLAVLLAAELGTDWQAATHPAMWLIYLLIGLGLAIVLAVAWLFASAVWIAVEPVDDEPPVELSTRREAA